MTLIKIMVIVLGAGIEIYCIYNFFESILEKIKISKQKLIAAYFIYLVIYILIKIKLFDHSEIMMLAVFLFTLSVSFLYEKSVIYRVVACTILMIIMVLTEFLAGMLLVFFTSQDINSLRSNPFSYLQGTIISKIMLLIIIKALKLYKYSSYYRISRLTFAPLMALPISSTVMVYTIIEFSAALTKSRPIILIGTAIFLLIISNILVFYLFEKSLKFEEDKRKTQLIQQQLKIQADYFKDLSEKHMMSNKAIHDTKNQLFAISIALQNNETELAKEKIDLLCSNVFNTLNISKTGNNAIDALINSKYQLILNSGIRFKNNFLISSDNQIDDIELCIIIGNALDNAIEACQKIMDSNKEINIKAVQIGNYLSIEISNTTSEAVKILNGRLITTKRDKDFHGFGIQNIEEIVKKYDGHMNFSQENNVFSLKIYLKNFNFSPLLQK